MTGPVGEEGPAAQVQSFRASLCHPGPGDAGSRTHSPLTLSPPSLPTQSIPSGLFFPSGFFNEVFA